MRTALIHLNVTLTGDDPRDAAAVGRDVMDAVDVAIEGQGIGDFADISVALAEEI